MHFTKEEIEKARSIDMLTYLEVNEPWNLIHVSGGTYCLKEHDSPKTSNGKWMWRSRGFGGTSALRFYKFGEAANP